MADRLVKVVGNHVKGCAGVRLTKEKGWPHPWGPIPWRDGDKPTVSTWRRYGKNGRALKTWVRFVCNDTKCKAELHVEAEFILKAATDDSDKEAKRG